MHTATSNEATDSTRASAPDVLCWECEHAAILPPRRPSLLREWLRLPPRPPECRVRVHDVSGLGSLPCLCRNTAHFH